MKRSLHKQSCPTCGQSVNERTIVLFKGMTECLFQVLQYCEARGVYEFKKKDVKHLLTDVVSSNFAYWRWFGGLVYNPNDIPGNYGLNVNRCRAFFAGQIKIPTTLIKNPLTNEIRAEDERYIHEIPHITNFLDNNQNYIARYREPQGQLFYL